MILNEIAAAEQSGFPILTVLIFLPLFGAVIIWLFQKDEDLIRKSAVAIAGLELFISVLLLKYFVSQSADIQFSERIPWITDIRIGYQLAVEGNQLCVVYSAPF